MARTQSDRQRRSSSRRDWFVAAAERVHASGTTAQAEILAAVEALDRGRQARLDGASISAVADVLIGAGGRDTRLAARDAFIEFERSIQLMRARVVRAFVEDEGVSLTEAARRLRISRQAAARLYEATAGLGDLGPGDEVT